MDNLGLTNDRPTTEQIFMSVERGRGTDAVPAIVKVNHGELEILELGGIPQSQVSIPNEPNSNAMLEFEPQQVYAITDVKYYKGEVFVTGITNQSFASTLAGGTAQRGWNIGIDTSLRRQVASTAIRRGIEC